MPLTSKTAEFWRQRQHFTRRPIVGHQKGSRPFFDVTKKNCRRRQKKLKPSSIVSFNTTFAANVAFDLWCLKFEVQTSNFKPGPKVPKQYFFASIISKQNSLSKDLFWNKFADEYLNFTWQRFQMKRFEILWVIHEQKSKRQQNSSDMWTSENPTFHETSPMWNTLKVPPRWRRQTNILPRLRGKPSSPDWPKKIKSKFFLTWDRGRRGCSPRHPSSRTLAGPAVSSSCRTASGTARSPPWWSSPPSPRLREARCWRSGPAAGRSIRQRGPAGPRPRTGARRQDAFWICNENLVSIEELVFKSSNIFYVSKQTLHLCPSKSIVFWEKFSCRVMQCEA